MWSWRDAGEGSLSTFRVRLFIIWEAWDLVTFCFRSLPARDLIFCKAKKSALFRKRSGPPRAQPRLRRKPTFRALRPAAKRPAASCTSARVTGARSDSSFCACSARRRQHAAPRRANGHGTALWPGGGPLARHRGPPRLRRRRAGARRFRPFWRHWDADRHHGWRDDAAEGAPGGPVP